MSGYNKLFLIIEFGKERRLNLFFLYQVQIVCLPKHFFGEKTSKRQNLRQLSDSNDLE